MEMKIQLLCRASGGLSIEVSAEQRAKVVSQIPNAKKKLSREMIIFQQRIPGTAYGFLAYVKKIHKRFTTTSSLPKIKSSLHI